MASPQSRSLPAWSAPAADTRVHARCGRLAGRLAVGTVAVVAASLTLAVLPGDAAAAPGEPAAEAAGRQGPQPDTGSLPKLGCVPVPPRSRARG